MSGYNNFQWSPDGRRYRYHLEAQYDGHCVDHTSDDGGFTDATTRNASEDLRSLVQGWPYSSQGNNNNDDNHLAAAAAAAAAAYRRPSQEPFVHEAFDAGSGYRNESQHSELHRGTFPADITRQEPPTWDTHPQPLITLPYPMRTPCANRYEDTGPSLEELAWPRFDPRMARGSMQQEPSLEADNENTLLCRDRVPVGGPANMMTNHWVGTSLPAEQANRQMSEQVDQDHGYPEEQPNVHLNPQPQTRVRPSPTGYAMTQTNRTLFSSSEPWSPENTRRDDLQGSLDFQTSELVQQIGSSGSYSERTGYDNTESTRTDDLDTSVTSLNMDVDLMESVETLRPEEPSFESQTLSNDNYRALPTQDLLVDEVSWPGAAGFRYHVQPSTPPFRDDVDPSLQFPEDPEYLPVSQSHTSTSEVSSPVSATSLPLSDVIQCTVCLTEFHGDYRKGNLSRHVRQKHGGRGFLPCEDDNCLKIFKRQDARLKHYRKYHPYLAHGPPISRGSQSLRQRSRSRTPVGRHELRDLVLSNVSGWTSYPIQDRHD